MKNRVYESMTRVRVNGYAVRVWRDEPELAAGDNHDIVRALTFAPRDAMAADLIRIVEMLPRVVAVEVLDADGNGILLYPDWS